MQDDLVASLENIKGADLDRCLEHGWYRTRHYVFTTHYVALSPFEPHYRVLWLRYLVNSVQLNKQNQQMAARNKSFTVSCFPFELTLEVDALHKRYAKNLKFDANDELAEILGDTGKKFFDSHIITVRDNGKLIAAGIFDKGENSIAGIINFYDPEYKKYSPGKYLMLEKWKYCLRNNIEYYYPGYYMPDFPVFDYKLFLDKGATEVFVPESGAWVGYGRFVEALKKAKDV